MNTELDPQAERCLSEVFTALGAPREFVINIIARYLKEACRTQGKEWQKECTKLVTECDALKASNAELREQLAANAKFISELQHTLRLVQGTHAQQVRECVEKAQDELLRYNLTQKGQAYIHSCAVKAVSKMCVMHIIDRGTDPDGLAEGIICEAFGAPVNEYENALQKAWEARKALGNAPHFVDFRDGFHAAWTLAKGKP